MTAATANARTRSAETRFERLLVARTYPTVWENDAAEIAPTMLNLIGSLLDPSLPGVASLRSRSLAGKWLTGPEAMGALERDVALWFEVASSNEPAELRFEQLTGQGPDCAISFDYDRLAAVNQQLDPDAELSPEAGGLIFSFRSDWSMIGTDGEFLYPALTWTPMLLISHGPFRSEVFSSPEVDARAANAELGPVDAARMLEDEMWIHAETAFLYARYGGDVPDARYEINDEQLAPPVFYYLAPSGHSTGPPVIADPDLSDAMRTVTARALGTSRLAAGSISRGTIDDRFVGFRRNVTHRTYYVLLDCRSDSVFEPASEAFARAVDELSYVETTSSALAAQLIRSLERRNPQLTSWANTVQHAWQLDAELFDHLSLARSTRGRRNEDVKLIERLHAGFRRFDRMIRPAMESLASAGAEFDDQMRDVADRARRRLGFSTFPHTGQQLDQFDDLPALQAAKSAVDIRVAIAGRLQDSVDDTTRAWEETVSTERVLREELRTRQERVVGIGLAMIAALGAFPLLIGSGSWTDLSSEVDSWARPFDRFGDLLQRSHATLTLLAVAVAAVLLLFLVGAFALRGIQRLRRIDAAIGPKGTSILAAKSASAATFRALQAQDLEALDAHDREGFEHLVDAAGDFDIAAWVTDQPVDVDVAVRTLLLKMELVDYRPTEVFGVRQAGFYYGIVPRLVGEPIMTSEEFDLILRINGMSAEQAELRRMQLDEFVGSFEELVELIRDDGFAKPEMAPEA